MKLTKSMIGASITALALSTCFTISCKKSNVTNKAIVANAIVMDEGDPASDGCGWVIKITGTDSLYSPSNLPDIFKADSVKVNVSYTILNSKSQCGFIPGHGYTQIDLGTIAKQ